MMKHDMRKDAGLPPVGSPSPAGTARSWLPGSHGTPQLNHYIR